MFASIAINCARLSTGAIADAVGASLRAHRLAYLREFPVAVDAYIGVLSELGELCGNYAAGSAKAAYRLHPVINVVRCQPAPRDGPQRVQETGGALPPHSGRSFAQRRPLYLAMLMADPGWTDAEPGRNGESLIIRWGDVLIAMRERYPREWAEDRRLLAGVSAKFAASFLAEEPSGLPVLYLPGEPRPVPVAEDVAVRLPQVVERLRHASGGTGNGGGADGARWFEAVRRLAVTASSPGVAHRYAMARGDVVILDNDRYGHGRCEVIATRGGEVNPRTLWSVNIQ